MGRSWTSWVVVIFVVFLITYIPISAQWFIFSQTLPWRESWMWFILLAFFDFSVVMVWINYYLAVFTDPGRVPSGWKPSESNQLLEVKQSTGAPRYCRICDQYKPPRAHHCSSCNRCVLKMDHHCPWIANCVGHKNHGHFIRFVFWVDVATTICVGLVAWQVYDWVMSPYPTWYYSDQLFLQMVVAISDLILGVPVWLSVGVLSLYHFYYLLNNYTTIESMEKERKALVRRHDGSLGSLQNPYSINWRSNVASVLGGSWLTACLPKHIQGDGTTFPINAAKNQWEYIVPAEAAQPHQGSARYSQNGRMGDEGYEFKIDPRTYTQPPPGFVNPYADYYSSIRADQAPSDEEEDNTPLLVLQQRDREVRMRKNPRPPDNDED